MTVLSAPENTTFHDFPCFRCFLVFSRSVLSLGERGCGLVCKSVFITKNPCLKPAVGQPFSDIFSKNTEIQEKH